MQTAGLTSKAVLSKITYNTAMDLVALSKKAIQNPFNFRNVFVLFITGFLVLIVGLSLISILGKLAGQVNPETACNSSLNKEISGQAYSSNDVVYRLDYRGNSQCFLSAFLTWKNPKGAVSLWVYDPDGKVEVIKPLSKQTYAQFYKASPLPIGEWKFVIKAVEAAEVTYFGNLSVR